MANKNPKTVEIIKGEDKFILSLNGSGGGDGAKVYELVESDTANENNAEVYTALRNSYSPNVYIKYQRSYGNEYLPFLVNNTELFDYLKLEAVVDYLYTVYYLYPNGRLMFSVREMLVSHNFLNIQYYTKEEVDEKLISFASKDDVYTKGEMDAMLSVKTDDRIESHPYYNEYFTIEALEDGVFKFQYLPENGYYSINGGEWTKVSSSPIDIKAGDKMRIKAEYVSGQDDYDDGFIDIYTTKFKCKIYGNISSLYESDDFINTEFDVWSAGVPRLFYKFAKMNVVDAGDLVIANLTNIEKSVRALGYMFYDDSLLNRVMFLFTQQEIDALSKQNYTFQGFMSGVAPTGTFIKRKNTVWPSGVIPSGWTVVDYEGKTASVVTAEYLRDYTYDKATIDEKISSGGSGEGAEVFEIVRSDTANEENAKVYASLRNTHNPMVYVKYQRGYGNQFLPFWVEKNDLQEWIKLQVVDSELFIVLYLYEDGRLENVVQQLLVDDATLKYNYYTKQEVDEKISQSGGGSVDAYTKQESDDKFATKTEVNQKYLQKEGEYVKAVTSNGGAINFEKGNGTPDVVNFKTINGQSIIGMDNISVSGMSAEDKQKLDATPSFWSGTKAEYDAITTKDPNTVYFIKQQLNESGRTDDDDLL